MNDLTGKVALITGASRGIGRATALLFAARGAKVLCAARSHSAARELVDEIHAKQGQALAVSCDVTRFEDLKKAVATAKSQYGRLDILVNNAGVIDPISQLADSDPDVWGTAVDVNLKGVYHGMRAALPVMKEQGAGTIINLSSGAANSALEGWSHYCATKAAAKRLTEVAHKEMAGYGLVIVGLSPGTVATDMMRTIKDSGVNPVSQIDWADHIPPEWVAKAILFLCGPEGAEFSGTDFSIKTDEGRARVGLPPITR